MTVLVFPVSFLFLSTVIHTDYSTLCLLSRNSSFAEPCSICTVFLLFIVIRAIPCFTSRPNVSSIENTSCVRISYSGISLPYFIMAYTLPCKIGTSTSFNSILNNIVVGFSQVEANLPSQMRSKKLFEFKELQKTLNKLLLLLLLLLLNL